MGDGILRARIRPDGHYCSLVRQGRRPEWLAPGSRGNELQLFHDKPTLWDAWDIDPDYEKNPAKRPSLCRRRQ
uniref:glycoside hydrolase family 38 C-terminal domain-containing protein n=1 Tax=Cohnella faecalis TaxID=2315694 RepID=UPI00398965A3